MKRASSGSTFVGLPAASSSKPCGWFIHELTATTLNAPPMPAITIGTPLQKCSQPREPVPAVDVDRDEDRLGEEEDPLDREAGAEDVAPALHELRPEQPHLEGEDRAGDGADREQDRRRLRPELREAHRVVVVVAPAAVLGDQHDRRERDADAREDDVEARA